jgi:hypothetical protein
VLGEGPPLSVPAPLHDLGIDPVAFTDPAAKVGRATVVTGQPDHAVKGHPAHEPAIGEVLPTAAGLPDALVGLVPMLAHPVGELGELDPAGMADPESMPVGQPDRVQQLTVDVQLELVGGPVANPDRLGAGIALPVV